MEWLYENSDAGTTHNILDDYLEDEDEAGNYVSLYNNDDRIDILYHDIYDRHGNLWRGCDRLDSKKNCYVSFRAENEAMRLIFWAVQNGYTVKELYKLAA